MTEELACSKELVWQKTDSGEVVTDSLRVAEVFGKRHDHVLRGAESLMNGIPQNWGLLFYKDSYKKTAKGRSYPLYYMNKDGFTLLAMGVRKLTFVVTNCSKKRINYMRGNFHERAHLEKMACTKKFNKYGKQAYLYLFTDLNSIYNCYFYNSNTLYNTVLSFISLFFSNYIQYICF